MNRTLMIAAALAPLTACTVVEQGIHEEFSAAGVNQVVAHLDGDLSYTGLPGQANLVVDGRSYGTARDEELASDRMEDNSWNIQVQDDTLALTGDSDRGLAGLELDVMGPEWMNLDLAVDGRVELTDVAGVISVDADSIYAQHLAGDVRLLSSGSVTAELLPFAGDSVLIEAGSVNLELPYGGGYDIQVWGSPEASLVIEDLGFHHVVETPGYFAGISGDGSVRVDIHVESGSVQVSSAW